MANRPAPQVLVVEDDPAIRNLLRATLLAEGYVVHEAGNARDGEVVAAHRPIDLFLVDLGLPDDDGVALIRRLRQWTARPILVLSARMLERQKVEALDAGADDYLVKPFGVAELHARLRVARRLAQRREAGSAKVLKLGAVRIDLDAASATRGGTPLRLTATQWRVLEVLARADGRVVSTRQLLHEAWGPAHVAHGHYLRIYVRQLRQRLEDTPSEPRYLLTETGVGYRLLSDAEADADPGDAGATEAGPPGAA
jgi:two-component system KDP operon response regulator KdpE